MHMKSKTPRVVLAGSAVLALALVSACSSDTEEATPAPPPAPATPEETKGPDAPPAKNATVSVLHAIPQGNGADIVDIYVNGESFIENATPGQLQTLPVSSGLYDIAVYGDDTYADGAAPVLSIDDVQVAAGDNATVTANLDAEGNPALNIFSNNVSEVDKGNSKLTVRHIAAAPAVNVKGSEGNLSILDLSYGQEATVEVPAGSYNVSVNVAETDKTVIGPAPLNLVDRRNNIVYAWGAPDALNLAIQVAVPADGLPDPLFDDVPVEGDTTEDEMTDDGMGEDEMVDEGTDPVDPVEEDMPGMDPDEAPEGDGDTSDADAGQDVTSSSPPPVIVDPSMREVTAPLGALLDIVVDNPVADEVTSSDESVLVVSQGYDDGSAVFNPSGIAAGPGEATLTVTPADGEVYEVQVTVIEGEANPGITDEQLEFSGEIIEQGLALTDAVEVIEGAGYTWRVVEEDGEFLPATMDYRTERLSLSVTDGVVTDATWG